MEQFEKQAPGSITGRTAGSHGFFDVIVIEPNTFDPERGVLRLIQAKSQRAENPTSTNVKAWEKMKLIKVPLVVTVRKEFWIRFPGGHKIAWGQEGE
jgi:hypothetical protein